jgi:23S rRNA pseudouridine955/2504/2580 synthase
MPSTKIGTEADFGANSASIPCALPYSDAAFGHNQQCSNGKTGSQKPPLTIIRETPHLLFVNKPPGISTHGKNSLDEMAAAYLRGKIEASLSFRPGPLHRLDRETSGVITFSKSLTGARDFSCALRSGRIQKTYIAILEGRLEQAETWADMLAYDGATRRSYFPPELPPTGGRHKAGSVGEGSGAAKPALTTVKPLAVRGGRTLALIKIDTGRTHQIRAQAALRGFPLEGDTKYGGKRRVRKAGEPAFFLHALCLELPPEPPSATSQAPEPPSALSAENAAAHRGDLSMAAETIYAPLPVAFAQAAAVFGLPAGGVAALSTT